MSLAVIADTAAWHPLNQQYWEDDTTFLLDPDGDATAGLTPGFGAIVPSLNVNAATVNPSVAAGKFRRGFSVPSSGSVQPYYVPADGLLGTDQFTIETWIQFPADWSTLATNLLGIGGGDAFSFVVAGSVLKAQIQHYQNPGSSAQYLAAATYSFASGVFPANTWCNIAATLTPAGVLTLYANGAQVTQATGVVLPKTWAAGGPCVLWLPGAGGPAPSGMKVSDLRISRLARTLGQTLQLASSRRTVVAVGGSTGRTIALLSGGLHDLTRNGSSGDQHVPPSASDTVQATSKGLQVIRTAGLVNDAVIKAGAPDGTHPTAGHSGSYSYDWQVVDRTLNYCISTLGATSLYLDLDFTPQILGGTNAPPAGTALTEGYTFVGPGGSGPVGNNPQVPSSNSDYATIAADLVYHIITELGLPLTHVTLWNEPTGSSFWLGTQTQWINLYGAVMPPIKALFPSLKVGGPDDSWDSLRASWFPALITACAANGWPLDFLSSHYGAGNGSMYQMRNVVDALCTAAGIASPELCAGEMTSWELSGGMGRWPWWQPELNPPWQPIYTDPGPDAPTNYFINDWGAGWVSAYMINGQKNGMTRFIYCDPGVLMGGYSGDMTINTSAIVQVYYNVCRMWNKMVGLTEKAVSVAGDAGIVAVAAQGGGKTYVMLSSLHYRKTQSYGTLIDLTGLGIADGTNVTAYVVDDSHSNAYDAGTAHADLETASTAISPQGVGKVSDAHVGFDLSARAAALLVIG